MTSGQSTALEKLRQAQFKGVKVARTPGTTGSATSPLHRTSMRAIGRAFVSRIRQLGASGQKSIRKRLRFLSKTADKYTSGKGPPKPQKESRSFSSEFEGRVYSILAEKRTMSPLETQKAKRDLSRREKFNQSLADRKATERTGFVHDKG